MIPQILPIEEQLRFNSSMCKAPGSTYNIDSKRGEGLGELLPVGVDRTGCFLCTWKLRPCHISNLCFGSVQYSI